MNPVYLDHASTTPLHPAVLDAMLPFLRDGFGNASSAHAVGRAARRAVETAREQVAASIGAEPREIIFTSGGTEANHLAVMGLRVGKRVVVSAIEHPAVMAPAKRRGDPARMETIVCPVDEAGRLAVHALAEILTDDVGLVSVMVGNNETGVMQPLNEVATLCAARGVLLHTDAVQAIGKTPIDVNALGCTALSLSAHKINGPQGVGALYIRHGAGVAPLLVGGAQARKRRAGTEHVAGIVGLGAACEQARVNLTDNTRQWARLRDRMEAAIRAQTPDCWVNGLDAPRLPHISNIGFAGIEGEVLLYALDDAGVAVSTGSACSAGSLDPSPVLLAMGQNHARAQGAIRFSVGLGVDQVQVDHATNAVVRCVATLRA